MLPYFAIFEFLSPLFALLGLLVTVLLWAFGVVSTSYVLLFFVVSIGLGAAAHDCRDGSRGVRLPALRPRRDTLRLLGYAVLENFGYHQLHDIWRTIGYIDIARGKKGWGTQRRRGFTDPGDEAARSAEVPTSS